MSCAITSEWRGWESARGACTVLAPCASLTRRGAAAADVPSPPRQQPPSLSPIQPLHRHYSNRAPWLRALVLGANDGLVSVASLMMGVGGGTEDKHTLILSGVAGLVGGAL